MPLLYRMVFAVLFLTVGGLKIEIKINKVEHHFIMLYRN